jgi:hypothetical protein
MAALEAGNGEVRNRRRMWRLLVKVVSTMDIVEDTVDEEVDEVASEEGVTVEMGNLAVDAEDIEAAVMHKRPHNNGSGYDMELQELALYQNNLQTYFFSASDQKRSLSIFFATSGRRTREYCMWYFFSLQLVSSGSRNSNERTRTRIRPDLCFGLDGASKAQS